MKKLTILFLVAIFITGIVSAQPIKDQYTEEQLEQNLLPGNEQVRSTHSHTRNEQMHRTHPQTRNEQRCEVNPQARNENKIKTHPQPGNEQMRRTRPQSENEQMRSTPPHTRDSQQREVNIVTINGILKLERGFIAVQSESAGEKDHIFYVPMLNRFAGFINGMTEGKSVTVEGYQFRNFIQPVKFTIDGRTYDFPRHNYVQRNNHSNCRCGCK